MSVSTPAAGEALGTLEPLGDGVYAYVQPDGSWWVNNAGFVVGPNFVTLVDTASTERRTRALLRTVGDTAPGLPVRVVVNTHHHGDHSFGNSLVPDALVLGQARARADMAGFGEPPVLTSWNQIAWGEVHCRVPEVTFETGVTVWHGEQPCEVRHVGRTAHTHGDVIVWLPGPGVLFAGDLLFNGGTPFVLGGSIAGLIEVLDRFVLPLQPDRIVPGHGPVCGTEVVERTTEYLVFLQRAAADGRARGLSPLACASGLALGDFGGWLDAERIVANLHRAYAELPGSDFVVDETRAFADMVALNGGPLRTIA